MPLPSIAVHQVLVYLSDRFLVVFGQFHLFPESFWEGGSFNCFHVEVDLAVLFSDGAVLRVGQRACFTGTEAGYVVRVLTESAGFLGVHFYFEGAVLFVSDCHPY